MIRILIILSILTLNANLFILQNNVCAAEHSKVLQMRWLDDSGERLQLVFDLSEPTPHNTFTLAAEKDKAERVVIDLSNAALLGALLQKPQYSDLLLNIRSAPRHENDLRVVLDVAQTVKINSFTLKPAGRFGHRLVVTLSTIKPQAPLPQVQKQLVKQTQIRQRPMQTKRINSLPTPMAAMQPMTTYPPLKATQKTTQKALLPSGKRKVLVAIDAGHGGIDPGAVGKRGVYEKTVVLAIARKLAKRINQEPGMQALMVRNGDYYLRLRERIDFARSHQADLFISIHADAYEKRKYHLKGASVYILSQNGASSEAAHWLAQKENASDLLGGVSLNDKEDILASVLLDLSQTGTLESSGQLAQSVLTSLGGVGSIYHRKVQQAAFMVLRSPDMPSILVETAFLSNPAEEKKLASAAYQAKLAKSIFAGIRRYLQDYAPPGTLIARH
ncbi:N-acetylmuramoyl-L-alanine amidase [Candidatus Venteria ishoeyi]|uniref:N-acetylmuramoyl-L-alanine amidase n=1 Tax=Candidatus Venteria ishoeyi TaxID=1899563 RepID=UPI0025A65E78|nr:N-acetylmuramoyl-L-alanine amidase [Candidatus Venteria ishoeyi]MDM8545870.1 N-acetylmuramoyl-L-alanine amidase [Candidatus Venteria ishoeyi]